MKLIRENRGKIRMYRNGVKGVSDQVEIRLNKGVDSRIEFQLSDDQRRMIDIISAVGNDADVYDDENPRYELEAILVNPRDGNVFRYRPESLDVENANKGIVHFNFSSDATANLFPGKYTMSIMLRDCKELKEELLVTGSGGNPHIPVTIDKGILPEPYPTEIVEFEPDIYRPNEESSEMRRYISYSIDAGSFRSRRSHMHTIAVYFTGSFTGSFGIQGTLDNIMSGTSDDGSWFDINFDDATRKNNLSEYAMVYDSDRPGTGVEPFHFRISAVKFRFWQQPSTINNNQTVLDAKNMPHISKILLRN